MTIAPYPLQWPASRPRTRAIDRKSGRFSRKEYVGTNTWQTTKEMTVSEAIKRLQSELDRIGATYAVVSSNLEIRLDGLPRSGQRQPDDPGVAVYFQLRGKSHCLPCDTYREVHSNIAAVAAHIAATRAIERHGVASVAEMFSGFAALTPPGAKSWWDILQVRPDASREAIEASYRRLAELNAARDAALRERS
jgi:hypothetical protein